MNHVEQHVQRLVTTIVTFPILAPLSVCLDASAPLGLSNTMGSVLIQQCVQ